MSDLHENPSSVVWSHSNSIADFYELPSGGEEMHEALGWLIKYYDQVNLWIGVESDEGAELYLICSPTFKEEVVNRLTVYDDPFDPFLVEPEQPAVRS